MCGLKVLSHDQLITFGELILVTSIMARIDIVS